MGDDIPHITERPKPRGFLRSVVVLGCLTLGCTLASATTLQLLTEENPPLNFSENGQAKGLSVEVVQEIQRRVGNTDLIDIQPWSRAYRTASTVPNVAIFIMARTPAREDLFQWVGPVSASVASLYGKRGSGLRITNLDEAKAIDRILVVRDFYTHQLLQKLGFTNLELVSKPEAMVKMAVMGRAPVMFAANVTLGDLLEKAGAKRGDVELLYTLTSLQTYIGFSLGTPKETVNAWQSALDAMKRDGSYNAIYAKWLPGETPTKIKPEPNLSP